MSCSIFRTAEACHVPDCDVPCSRTGSNVSQPCQCSAARQKSIAQRVSLSTIAISSSVPRARRRKRGDCRFRGPGQSRFAEPEEGDEQGMTVGGCDSLTHGRQYKYAEKVLVFAAHPSWQLISVLVRECERAKSNAHALLLEQGVAPPRDSETTITPDSLTPQPPQCQVGDTVATHLTVSLYCFLPPTPQSSRQPPWWPPVALPGFRTSPIRCGTSHTFGRQCSTNSQETRRPESATLLSSHGFLLWTR